MKNEKYYYRYSKEGDNGVTVDEAGVKADKAVAKTDMFNRTKLSESVKSWLQK